MSGPHISRASRGDPMLHISFPGSYLSALKPAIGRRPRRWPWTPSTCSSAFGSRPDRRPSWLMFQRHAQMYLIRGTNEIENSVLVAFASHVPNWAVAVRFTIRTSHLVDNVFRQIIHSQPTFDNDIRPTLSSSGLRIFVLASPTAFGAALVVSKQLEILERECVAGERS